MATDCFILKTDLSAICCVNHCADTNCKNIRFYKKNTVERLGKKNSEFDY